MPKIHKVSRDINGISVEQRQTDGFINATAMCVAHGRKIDAWFRTQDTLELFQALANDKEINYSDLSNSDPARLSATKYSKIFKGLLLVKGGSPVNGGGVWLHPDLAIQLAQWCNKIFALQVSRWVQEWMTSAYNPVQLEADADRVRMRDSLKDQKRLEFTGQIKSFLLRTGNYDTKSWETRLVFSRSHDYINIRLTTETAQDMRDRLSKELGKQITEGELLRDYYPIEDLANFAAICQAAANEMHFNKVSPNEAIDRAMNQVLPRSYQPQPIDFSERIALVRLRIQQRDQLPLGSA